MKRIVVLIFLSLNLIYVAQSQVSKVPATTTPIEYTQPDGKVVTILLKGDENLHWAETLDGYTLLSNPVTTGYEYAKLDKNNNLISSGKVAHNEKERNKKEIRFLKKIQKNLSFSVYQINNSKNK